MQSNFSHFNVHIKTDAGAASTFFQHLLLLHPHIHLLLPLPLHNHLHPLSPRFHNQSQHQKYLGLPAKLWKRYTKILCVLTELFIHKIFWLELWYCPIKNWEIHNASLSHNTFYCRIPLPLQFLGKNSKEQITNSGSIWTAFGQEGKIFQHLL